MDQTDVAAAGTPRLAVWLYGLAAWCVMAVIVCVLATVPLHDAPRAVRFVPPVPEIARSWLMDVPVMLVVIGGGADAPVVRDGAWHAYRGRTHRAIRLRVPRA